MLQTIPVRPEDEAFLYELYASTRAAEIRSWGWDEAAQAAFLQMQWRAQSNSYAVQYPEADQQIIIFQNIRAGRVWTARQEEALVLVDLSLLPEFRGQGIGTRLLQDLQTTAAREGKPLRLSVLLTNPAQRLYERLGFQTIGNNGVHRFMEWRSDPNIQ